VLDLYARGALFKSQQCRQLTLTEGFRVSSVALGEFRDSNMRQAIILAGCWRCTSVQDLLLPLHKGNGFL
jgi:hypothetical protein